jgi:hypothetical protein
MVTGAQKISFGLMAFDRMNGSANQDGIYSAKLFLDDKLQIEFVIDSIDYAATRYMNAQIDYRYRQNGGAFLQHLSRLPGDQGGIYHPVLNDGVISFDDNDEHTVLIEITDARKNSTSLQFKVRYDSNLSTQPSEPAQMSFIPNQVNLLNKPDFECYLPAACLYDTMTPVYSRNASAAANAVSALYGLNDETIPLHIPMTIRIRPDRELPDNLKNKLVIRRSYGGSTSTRAAQWQDNGWVSADFGDFGSFQVFTDTEAPFVNGIGSGDTVNLSGSSRIAFTPVDNSGIKSFRAELDDQWLRFTNDKSRSWIYIFDERCPYGVHKLKVTVEDIVGNSSTRTWWFKKYAYTPPKKKVVKKKGGTKKKVTTKKKRK